MASTTIMTPGLQQVRRVAEQALTMTNGMAVNFYSKDYGGLENAGKASRAFQTAFSSFRQREHRKAQRRGGESENVRDSEILGPFDNLGSVRRLLAQDAGWEVRLVTSHALNMHIECVNLDTGEIVEQLDPDLFRIEALTAMMFKVYHQREAQKARMTDVLEPHDVEWLRVNYKDVGEGIYDAVGLVAPWVEARASAFYEPNRPDDLAELDDDVDPFGGGEGAVDIEIEP